jgi:hypothetical protein
VPIGMGGYFFKLASNSVINVKAYVMRCLFTIHLPLLVDSSFTFCHRLVRAASFAPAMNVSPNEALSQFTITTLNAG